MPAASSRPGIPPATHLTDRCPKKLHRTFQLFTRASAYVKTGPGISAGPRFDHPCNPKTASAVLVVRGAKIGSNVLRVPTLDLVPLHEVDEFPVLEERH